MTNKIKTLIQSALDTDWLKKPIEVATNVQLTPLDPEGRKWECAMNFDHPLLGWMSMDSNSLNDPIEEENEEELREEATEYILETLKYELSQDLCEEVAIYPETLVEGEYTQRVVVSLPWSHNASDTARLIVM